MSSWGRSRLTAAQQQVMDALVEQYLAELGERTAAIVERLKAEIAEYAAVPAPDVELSTRAIIQTALTSIRDDAVAVDDIAALTELARRRVEQGFPLEALNRSVQLASRYLLQDLARLADGRDAGGQLVLYVSDLAWKFANDAAAVISTVSRDMAVELARRDSARRSDFLNALLHGTLDPRRVQAEATVYGLDPLADYFPLRARPIDQREEDALVLAIHRTGSTTTHRAVVGVIQGDLVGLSPNPPTVPGGTSVAIGEVRGLTDVHESFATTALTLDVALRFEKPGLVGLGDLGPLPLALAADELVGLLERHYFTELDKEAASRDIEDTVRAWLEHDRRAEDVAAVLHIHRNTVRYRVARFRELTGLDPRRTADLVMAWFLLMRRHVRRAPRDGGAGR